MHWIPSTGIVITYSGIHIFTPFPLLFSAESLPVWVLFMWFPYHHHSHVNSWALALPSSWTNIWTIIAFSCRICFLLCIISWAHCFFSRIWASTLSSHFLKSSALCFAPLLFQIIVFEFLQGFPLWSNLVNIPTSFLSAVTISLLLPYFFLLLPIFFNTSSSSPFEQLGQISKRDVWCFPCFFVCFFFFPSSFCNSPSFFHIYQCKSIFHPHLMRHFILDKPSLFFIVYSTPPPFFLIAWHITWRIFFMLSFICHNDTVI